MNKCAFVTGGSRGIGKALCLRLLTEGWDLVFTYASDVNSAKEALKEFSAVKDVRVFMLKVDVADLTCINVIHTFLVEHNLNLDAVIFNAGITDRCDLMDITQEAWERVFTANVHFPVFLLQKLDDRVNNMGSIIFTGSLMAVHPHSVSLAYGVSKSTVHALVKNLVKFYTERRIRVNGVAPGFVETDWHKTKSEAIRHTIYSKIAAARFCEPNEITDVYMLLLNNSYMNGEIVVCDGGYSYK